MTDWLIEAPQTNLKAPRIPIQAYPRRSSTSKHRQKYLLSSINRPICPIIRPQTRDFIKQQNNYRLCSPCLKHILSNHYSFFFFFFFFAIPKSITGNKVNLRILMINKYMTFYRDNTSHNSCFPLQPFSRAPLH